MRSRGSWSRSSAPWTSAGVGPDCAEERASTRLRAARVPARGRVDGLSAARQVQAEGRRVQYGILDNILTKMAFLSNFNSGKSAGGRRYGDRSPPDSTRPSPCARSGYGVRLGLWTEALNRRYTSASVPDRPCALCLTGKAWAKRGAALGGLSTFSAVAKSQGAAPRTGHSDESCTAKRTATSSRNATIDLHRMLMQS